MDSINVRTQNFVNESTTSMIGASDVTRQNSYRSQLSCAMESIQDELQQVEKFLRNELRSKDDLISEMLSYVADLGGKRLRPTLLLLAAKSNGPIPQDAIRLAVVAELVHTATLIHDDILDHAKFRRHRPTLHSKWNIPSSLLVGDWLFTHAYALANRGSSTIPGRWVADAAKQVCEGEIMQGNSVKNFGITEAAYLNLLESKTGALCAVSCSLGAWSAGADESTCHALQQFGLKLGTAFQVFDDWLDVWGRSDEAGKTLGTDLASFKPTLPAIWALQSLEAPIRNELIERLNQGDVAAARTLRVVMDDAGSSAYTQQFAMELIKQSVSHLSVLPKNATVDALEKLAHSAVTRVA